MNLLYYSRTSRVWCVLHLSQVSFAAPLANGDDNAPGNKDVVSILYTPKWCIFKNFLSCFVFLFFTRPSSSLFKTFNKDSKGQPSIQINKIRLRDEERRKKKTNETLFKNREWCDRRAYNILKINLKKENWIMQVWTIKPRSAERHVLLLLLRTLSKNWK